MGSQGSSAPPLVVLYPIQRPRERWTFVVRTGLVRAAAFVAFSCPVMETVSGGGFILPDTPICMEDQYGHMGRGARCGCKMGAIIDKFAG